MASKREEGVEAVEYDPTNRYCRYNELLGTGSYKSVYRGFDQELGIEVAWNQVKTSKIPVTEKKTLFEEVTLLKHLRHDNIIECYHNWEDPSKEEVIFITELMSSGTLKGFITKTSPVNIKVVKNWCRQILSALQYLHTEAERAPIIHRDLKCDNIFVNGNIGQLKIGDLGLSTSLRNTYAQSVIGTPEFMAPELYEENYNEKVDIYAFGMCVLEMVTNQYPYNECENAAQIYKKVTRGQHPDALVRLEDGEVKSFIVECLAPEAQRPSAKDLLGHKFLLATDEDSKVTKHTLVKQKEAMVAVDRQSSTAAVVSTPTAADAAAVTTEKAPAANTMSEVTEAELFDSSRVIGRVGSNVAHFQIFGQIKGEKKLIKFEFDVMKDDSRKVAEEMIAEVAGLDRYNVELLDRVIRNLILKFKTKFSDAIPESSDDQQRKHAQSQSQSQLQAQIHAVGGDGVARSLPQPVITPSHNASESDHSALVLETPSQEEASEKLSPNSGSSAPSRNGNFPDEDDGDLMYKEALSQFLEKNMPQDPAVPSQNLSQSALAESNALLQHPIPIESSVVRVSHRSSYGEEEEDGDAKYETAYAQYLQTLPTEPPSNVAPTAIQSTVVQTSNSDLNLPKNVSPPQMVLNPAPLQPRTQQQLQPLTPSHAQVQLQQQQQINYASFQQAPNGQQVSQQDLAYQQQQQQLYLHDGSKMSQENLGMQQHQQSSAFFMPQSQQSQQQLAMNPVIYMTPQFQTPASNQMIYMPQQQQLQQQVFLSSQYQNQPTQLIYVLQSQQPHIFASNQPAVEPVQQMQAVSQIQPQSQSQSQPQQQPPVVVTTPAPSEKTLLEEDSDKMRSEKVSEINTAPEKNDEGVSTLQVEQGTATDAAQALGMDKGKKEEETEVPKPVESNQPNENVVEVVLDKKTQQDEEAASTIPSVVEKPRVEEDAPSGVAIVTTENASAAAEKEDLPTKPTEKASLEKEIPPKQGPNDDETTAPVISAVESIGAVSGAAAEKKEEGVGEEEGYNKIKETLSADNAEPVAGARAMTPTQAIAIEPTTIPAGESASNVPGPNERKSPFADVGREEGMRLPTFKVCAENTTEQELMRLNRHFLQYQQLLCEWQRTAVTDILRALSDPSVKTSSRRVARVSPVSKKSQSDAPTSGFVPVRSATGNGTNQDHRIKSTTQPRSNGASLPPAPKSHKPSSISIPSAPGTVTAAAPVADEKPSGITLARIDPGIAVGTDSEEDVPKKSAVDEKIASVLHNLDISMSSRTRTPSGTTSSGQSLMNGAAVSSGGGSGLTTPLSNATINVSSLTNTTDKSRSRILGPP